MQSSIQQGVTTVGQKNHLLAGTIGLPVKQHKFSKNFRWRIGWLRDTEQTWLLVGWRHCFEFDLRIWIIDLFDIGASMADVWNLEISTTVGARTADRTREKVAMPDLGGKENDVTMSAAVDQLSRIEVSYANLSDNFKLREGEIADKQWFRRQFNTLYQARLNAALPRLKAAVQQKFSECTFILLK